MNRDLCTEWLRERPALLARIVAFNFERSHSSRSIDSDETIHPWSAALRRHPAVGRCLTKPRTIEGYWGFEDPCERLALLDSMTLERIFRRMAAVLLAEELSQVVTGAQVRALKAFFSAELLHYALLRGRFQAGSLALRFKDFAKERPLVERAELLMRFVSDYLRETWPEALQNRTEALFTALAPRPEEKELFNAFLDEVGDETLRPRLKSLLRKLIEREGESPWKDYFN